MPNDKLQVISHPGGRGNQALLPAPSGRRSQALLPSPRGRGSQALLLSPRGRRSQALLPSPGGRGAGGEGTTLATNRTQPEPSPQPSLGDFRWSSPGGRGSQASALTRHSFFFSSSRTAHSAEPGSNATHSATGRPTSPGVPI